MGLLWRGETSGDVSSNPLMGFVPFAILPALYELLTSACTMNAWITWCTIQIERVAFGFGPGFGRDGSLVAGRLFLDSFYTCCSLGSFRILFLSFRYFFTLFDLNKERCVY